MTTRRIAVFRFQLGQQGLDVRDIKNILRALNKHKVRATYGAVGQALGVPAVAVGRLLGDQHREASWVVSARTGLPTGYDTAYRHPDLLLNDRIIRNAPELIALVVKPPSTAEHLQKTGRAKRLIGLDLAWNCERNGSGLAVGYLQGKRLVLEELHTGIRGLDRIFNIVVGTDQISGIAVDAPLLIKNTTGSRPCEKDLTGVYGSRWAGCHPSNLQLHANSAGLLLAERLLQTGFQHLGVSNKQWQIECYPHPAIVEIFELDKRLKYKKKKSTTWDEVRHGQATLGKLLLSLKERATLTLSIPDHLLHVTDPAIIAKLPIGQLKDNEDGLDAIVCLYIAGLYSTGQPGTCFGNSDTGYIWVPVWRE